MIIEIHDYLLKIFYTVSSRKMIINVRVLALIVLGIYGMCAHAADIRDPYKRANDKKYAGSMLAEIAKEFIQRSTTGSQVLNLNLSNLLLLLVLKAVVFGAGFIGHHGHKGRELENENIVSEGELTLALGYLIGDTCLYRAACEEPHIAREYLGAAEMLLQTIKLVPQSLPAEFDYEKTMAEIRKAIEYGSIEQCPPEYTCKKENINNFLQREKR